MKNKKHICQVLSLAVLLFCFLLCQNVRARSSEMAISTGLMESLNVPLPHTDKFYDWAANKRVEVNFMAYITNGEFDFDGFFAQLYDLTLAELERVPWEALWNYRSRPTTWNPPTYAPGEPIGNGILNQFAHRIVFPNETYKDKAENVYAGGISDAISSLASDEWLVYVTEGEYVELVLVERGNLVLAGDGWRTIISKPSDIANGSRRNNYIVKPEDVNNIIIRDLAFDGNRENNLASYTGPGGQACLRFENSTDCLTENVYAYNERQFGFINMYSTRIYTVNSVARDCWWNGFTDATGSEYCALIGCYVDTWRDVAFTGWESTYLLRVWCVAENPMNDFGWNNANWAFGVESVHSERPIHHILIRECYGSNMQAQSDKGTGVWVMENAHHVLIDRGTYGCMHAYGVRACSNNTIIFGNNVTCAQKYGIALWGSSNNIVSGNTLKNNGYAVNLRWQASDNKFYHNNFINNTQQVYIETSDHANFWDNSYPSGGNYWSDYTGVDLFSGFYQNETGSDGIGDTPYIIDKNNVDHYPLMNPWIPPDTTPPATTISVSGVLGDNKWYTSDVTITLFATDDTEVAKTEYSFDNATWIAYATPFNVTDEGYVKVYYKSTDKTGNVETTKTETIKIDKTAPTGTIMINNDYTYTTSTSVALTSTSTDATSGVCQVRFSNDGLWDTEPQEPFSTAKKWTLTSGDGMKTVYYQIKDDAGLISQSYSDTIVLDTTAPKILITSPSNGSEIDSSPLIVTWTESGGTQGASRYEIRLDNASWINVGANTTHTFTGLGDGSHTIGVKATDKAGNTKQEGVSFIVNTSSPPGPNYIYAAAITAATIITALGSTISILKMRGRRQKSSSNIKTPLS